MARREAAVENTVLAEANLVSEKKLIALFMVRRMELLGERTRDLDKKTREKENFLSGFADSDEL